MYCWEIVNTPLELLSFLLHCNASNLVREILKQQNMGGGQLALASPTPNSGDSTPPVPRYLHPWPNVE